MPYDAIVIGGGVNGLTCAALLGKAGLRVALVEQRDTLGGCALERQIAPGFRAPTLAHRTGPLRRDVVEELQLAQHGLRFSARSVRVTGLTEDGRALTIHADAAKTAAGLSSWSARDAEAWPAFAKSLAHLAKVVATLFERTPPDVDAPGRDDLWTLMRTIGAYRGLEKPDAWRLFRWGPMSVADLVSEHFETGLLRAMIAADGLLGSMMGPRSAGSGLHLLLHAANESLAAAPHAEVIGGPAAAADALAAAARRHGVDVRTGSAVGRIDVTDDRAIGVSLANGDELRARAVVSSVDPRRTFLKLCDADHLPPEFLWRIGNLRARGTLAKVNLALSALPEFFGVTRHALGSPVRIGPDLDYLERAYDHSKYGRMSTAPWIEFTIPSVFDAALAPDGAHVLSAYVQYMPFNLKGAGSEVGRSLSSASGGTRSNPADWEDHRDTLVALAIDTLAAYAPGIQKLVVAREVVTPLDLERDWGLTGGHIFHGELTLDQAFTMRPLLGWGRYRTPIRGLYLCGSGTHPGTGLTGGSGANAARELIRDLK